MFFQSTAPPFALPAFLLCFWIATVFGADSPQWGVDQGRNRISHERHLPTVFQPGKKDPTEDLIRQPGRNVRWVVPIGSRTYTPPVVAQNRVVIGTNNEARFEPQVEDDQGVLLCLDARTGRFLWQYTAPKVSGIKFFDVEYIGITSTPLVRDGHVYFVDNRGTVCVLNLNDGKPLWTLDLIKTFGVRQHDTNNTTVILHDGLLYLGTANGLDDRHAEMERPEAPTFVVLDAATGRPLARDDHWVQGGIAHGQWCCPALGEVVQNDETRVWTVFFGTGRGVVHAFAALNREKLLREAPAPEEMSPFGENLPKIQPDWTFDGNGPEALGEAVSFHAGQGSRSYTCLSPLVFADNRLFVLFCYDAFNGASPRRAYLAALDPTLSGGSTKASRLLWKTPNIDKGAMAPLAVDDGIVYLGDRAGGFHAFDAETGQTLWKIDLKGDHWAGPLVADGKIYLGTARRQFYVLRAGREPEILSEIEMPDALHAGATAADETLFVPINGFLYAIEKESDSP